MIHLVYHPVYCFCHFVTLMPLLLLWVVKVDNMYLMICHKLKLPQNRGNIIRYKYKLLLGYNPRKYGDNHWLIGTSHCLFKMCRINTPSPPITITKAPINF